MVDAWRSEDNLWGICVPKDLIQVVRLCGICFCLLSQLSALKIAFVLRVEVYRVWWLMPIVSAFERLKQNSC